MIAWIRVNCITVILVVVSAAIASSPSSSETSSSRVADWTARLEALAPNAPSAYFDLAEEIADAAEDEADRDLARHLFRLAGVLDREQFGRSACLALADLAVSEDEQRRYLALADLLDERLGVPNWLPGAKRDTFDVDAAVALSEVFALYRTGEGRRALDLLRDNPEAESLFERYGHVIGGTRRFRTNAEVPEYNNGERSPVRTDDELVRMIQLEAALLAGEQRSWSGELMIHGGRTLVEVDPEHLGEALGVDPARAYYRRGRWTDQP